MIKVRMIGGYIPNLEAKWGGAVATSYAFIKSFENEKEIDFKMMPSRELGVTEAQRVINLKEFIKDADVVHIDEDVDLCWLCEKHNIPVDVIGPTMRSPVKRYNGGEWKAEYSVDWFYSKKIVRLNLNEEKTRGLREEFRGLEFVQNVNLIKHGVDTERLVPSDKPKKYVLWAGDKYRYAKNYEMFEEIKKITELPQGYEFKTLSDYNIQDYWKILDETAILVNTSRYESFCAAMYEAQSKGVPTIYKKELHGERVHEESMLQIDYTPESYRDTILKLLNDKPYMKSLGDYNRDYAVNFASFKAMRDDLVEVYKEVIDDRK